VLCLKESWRYLRFIFDIKLSFHQHIDFYTNKAISMVKSMKMLQNSARGLILSQKCLLYRSCVSSIILYGFLLWFYNNVPLSYLLKVFRVMQHRVAIWILGYFKYLYHWVLKLLKASFHYIYILKSWVEGYNFVLIHFLLITLSTLY